MTAVFEEHPAQAFHTLATDTLAVSTAPVNWWAMNHDPKLAEHVVDGVWRLRSIPGANCSLVDLEAGGFALVDAGTPGAGATIVQLEVAPTPLLLNIDTGTTPAAPPCCVTRSNCRS
jgi:hypothetical protein